jgi:hypothetical protein
MNTRRTPGRVLGYHAEDEFAQFPAHASPACTSAMPREPFQYNLNPVRCQRTTVSGRTRTNAHFHPYQSRRNITQNNLSEIANRGCGCLRFKTASCCRRARFSRSNSRRERRSRIARTGRSLSRQSMSQSRMETGNANHAIHLIDLTADHYFGERHPK